MKLQFIAAHRRVGPLRKELGLADGTTRSYPLAAKVTSFTEEIDTTQGVKAYRDVLEKHAMMGHALYRGLFTKELVHERRRGLTDKKAKTEFLVLDIDGLTIENGRRTKATHKDVKTAAEQVLSLMPKVLQNTSYVAVASSSFGLKENEMSIHIHFLLDRPYEFRELKDWTLSLNYTQQAIFEKLKLTGSKMKLKSVVDPCLAEPARVVYIVPPLFGPKLDNPFANDTERFVAVEKKNKLLDLGEELDKLSEKMGIVELRRDELLRDLQRSAGVPTKKLKYRKMNFGGETHLVVDNPPQARLTFAYEDEEFVRYNMGAKQNNAFWVMKSNPEVVRSFNPDEPPFLFRVADPEAYANHIAKYGEAFETVVDEEQGIVRKVRRSMFIDQNTDTYTTLEYDVEHNEVIELRGRQNVKVGEEWLSYYGVMVPDPVPPAYVVMEPNRKEVIYEVGDKTYVNRFKPTKFMRSEQEHPTPSALRYGMGWTLSFECPVIAEVILHMLGDDFECYEHFINWLAFIFQERDKSGAAWVIHGEEGTGKGLFFHKVLAPLFGPDYAVQNTLQGIADDQFNGWMEDALILMVDEFNMSGASVGTKRAGALLRNLITEPTFMIRKMQQMQRKARQRLNFIFGTNDYDAMQVQDKRRYNIAVRQQRMLKHRLPAIALDWDSFSEVVEAELSACAMYLRSFQVNKQLVNTILENHAKLEMQEAGMTASDRFFDHIKRGDFSAFIGILDKSAAGLESKELLLLNKVKTFVTACMEHVNTGQPCYITKDDLRMLYGYLAGKEVSDNAFGRMMPISELVIKREANPVGALTPLNTRPRCIAVNWQYDDIGILNLMRSAHIALPKNVAPIKRDGPTEAEIQQQIMDEAREFLRS